MSLTTHQSIKRGPNEQLRSGARLIERASSVSVFATARSTPNPYQASMGCRSRGADMEQTAGQSPFALSYEPFPVFSFAPFPSQFSFLRDSESSCCKDCVLKIQARLGGKDSGYHHTLS